MLLVFNVFLMFISLSIANSESSCDNDLNYIKNALLRQSEWAVKCEKVFISFENAFSFKAYIKSFSWQLSTFQPNSNRV